MKRVQKCGECGATLAKKTVTHIQPWGEELFRFEKVPASVCVQCGRAWLSAQVSQRIDEIVQKHSKPKKFRRVQIFSLAELTKA